MGKEDFKEFKKNIRGKRVAVIGIGISNRPLVNYIVNLGANITVCDRKNREEIRDVCEEMEDLGIQLRLGDNYLQELNEFDIIFRTPSLRPDIPEIIEAKEKGAYVTSEMQEFIKYCPALVIGVTGSDGKTTTTTLIYNMLKEEGYNVFVGGNIGNPLFDKLDDIHRQDKVVLELSSFQLMDMEVSPNIAVVTNLSPNHLDIHKSMEEYIDSKKNVFRFQDNTGMLILNCDNDITLSMSAQSKGTVNYFSRLKIVKRGAYLKGEDLVLAEEGFEPRVCSINEIKLVGMHNIENLLAAFCAVKGLCSIDSLRKVALNFAGVEHRIEFVREIDGVKFYNDSIGSSPTRTIAGLNSFDQKVILIAGGYDKKIPFDKLAQVGVNKVKILVLLGVTADKIEAAFVKEMDNIDEGIIIKHAVSLDDAINIAKDNSKKGDIIIMSPACASFDMFKNFEERGNKFKEIVNSL